MQFNGKQQIKKLKQKPHPKYNAHYNACMLSVCIATKKYSNYSGFLTKIKKTEIITEKKNVHTNIFAKFS